MKALKAILLPAVLLFALSAAAAAQVPGLPSWGTFAGGKIDKIDVANLQVRFTIPIFSRKGAGLSLSVPLVMDNTNWFLSTNYPESWTPYGLNLYPPGVGGYVTADDTVEWCTDANNNEWSYNVYDNYQYIDPSGVIHPLVNPSNGGDLFTQDSDPCNQGGWPVQATGIASDGSGFQVVVDSPTLVSATSPSGVVYTPDTATDRNGNELTTTSSSTTVQYFDTLSPANGGAAALTQTDNYSNHTDTYSYTNPALGTSSYTVTRSAYTLQTAFGCQYVSEYSATAYLPTELQLPDGTKYTFSYETTPGYGAGHTTGRISEIGLPTGGFIDYTYTDGTGSACGQLIKLVRTTEDASHNPIATTTYQISGSTDTITDPANNVTVDTFNGTLLTEKQVYEGPYQSLLETEQYCYNGTVSNCTGTAFGTIDDEVEIPSPGGGTLNRHTQTTMDSVAGGPSEVQESDWSTSGEGGGWLKQTITTYGDATFPGLPTEVKVEDGGGATASDTTYTRDTRGNVITANYEVGMWGLTRHFSYNENAGGIDNGTLASETDVNSGTTTFTYGACNNAFPTKITEAVTSLTRSMIWDCNGGVMKSETDENGHATTWTYDDPNYWRPTQTTDAALNVTNLSYGNTGLWNVESAMTFNGGASTSDTLTTFDALGRPVLAQRRQAPGSSYFDTVETQYDVDGRPAAVSAPFTDSAGTVESNPPLPTATTYDALGRPLTVVDAGGGKTIYTYTGNDVLATKTSTSGGQSFSRQLEYDGLGRLSSVCEITTMAGSGTCGQTSSATGYWTKYSYNALGEITNVTQNAQGSPQQTRTFAYDELGRMTSETTPESGTTTFSYDLPTSSCAAGSDGDLVQRTDAAGNVTCYQYDALHRLTQISYQTVAPFASTPTRYFVYDSATVDGVAMANAEGRVAEAYTGSRTTDEGFYYDALGRQTRAYQESPNSGGWYVSSESYYASGAPDVVSLPGTGAPTITYGIDSEGRPTTVSAASGQNPVTAVAYGDGFVPGAPTSITLGSGDVDGYTFDDTTGRVHSYTFTTAGGVDAGTLGWNANGTMASLQISDGIAGTIDTQTCNYTYDDLARLASDNCGSNWSQTISYDPFGNIDASGSQSFGASYTAANHIDTNIGVPGNYDPDGDLLNDPVQSANDVNTFDAEGRAVTLEGVAVTYDALGRVVEAGGQEFAYAPDGRKMGLMGGQTPDKDYIPLPGGGTAVYNDGSLGYYMHADWQGSARLETGTSGSLYAAAAYSPYGYIYDASGPNTLDASFTGQRQDIEGALSGGQYSFLMRDQNPAQMRWWTPDPAGLAAVDPANPQSWNRYAYVDGQPLTSTDPLGLCTQINAGTVADSASGPCTNIPEVTVDGNAEDADVYEIYCFETATCQPFGVPPDVSYVYTGPGAPGAASNSSQTSDQAQKVQQSPKGSFAGCVSNGGQIFSAQGIANFVTDGHVGNGFIARMFLGNTFTSMVGALNDMASHQYGAAAADIAPDLASRALGPGLNAAAAAAPDVGLPGGVSLRALAQSEAVAVNAGLDVIDAPKNLVDAAGTIMSGALCAIMW